MKDPVTLKVQLRSGHGIEIPLTEKLIQRIVDEQTFEDKKMVKENAILCGVYVKHEVVFDIREETKTYHSISDFKKFHR